MEIPRLFDDNALPEKSIYVLMCLQEGDYPPMQEFSKHALDEFRNRVSIYMEITGQEEKESLCGLRVVFHWRTVYDYLATRTHEPPVALAECLIEILPAFIHFLHDCAESFRKKCIQSYTHPSQELIDRTRLYHHAHEQAFKEDWNIAVTKITTAMVEKSHGLFDDACCKAVESFYHSNLSHT